MVQARLGDGILYNGSFYHHNYRVPDISGVYGCTAFNKAKTLHAPHTAAYMYTSTGTYPNYDYYGAKVTSDGFVDINVLKPRF